MSVEKTRLYCLDIGPGTKQRLDAPRVASVCCEVQRGAAFVVDLIHAAPPVCGGQQQPQARQLPVRCCEMERGSPFLLRGERDNTLIVGRARYETFRRGEGIAIAGTGRESRGIAPRSGQILMMRDPEAAHARTPCARPMPRDVAGCALSAAQGGDENVIGLHAISTHQRGHQKGSAELVAPAAAPLRALLDSGQDAPAGASRTPPSHDSPRNGEE